MAALPLVTIGHAAQVMVPGSDTPVDAKVVTRAAQVDPGSATADVRLSFATPTHLAAGTVVQVSITGEEHQKAVIIPAAAIVHDEGETFVMVAGPDNKAHKYPITIGLTSGSEVEIPVGLSPGDRVIVRGQDGLPEGATITVEK
jgi:multidrug efflux pump subunit AcrA (membrane-fusion protein)